MEAMIAMRVLEAVLVRNWACLLRRERRWILEYNCSANCVPVATLRCLHQ